MFGKIGTFLALAMVIMISAAFLTVPNAQAGSVGLRWDHNDPLPDGYRVYMRTAAQPEYDYTNPIWDGQENQTGRVQIPDNTVVFFVVRAYKLNPYEGTPIIESADSDEVGWIWLTVPANITVTPMP
jgi:hypothetical protein